jgi:hypothetical protein
MYFYRAYNLTISSEQQFVELPKVLASQSPHVLIRLGVLQDDNLALSNRGDYFRGLVEGVASFEVRFGTEILVEPCPNVEDGRLRPLILGPLMSILLRQRGLLVLHASCVVLQGKAVAFMGDSGWGKSTLAELFYSQGKRLITDDVMAIEIEAAPPSVVPSYPQIKLMPDAALSLGHVSNSIPALHSHSIKLARSVDQDFEQTPVPLHCIYVLDTGSQHQISPISLQDAFQELVRHSRAVGLLNATDFRSAHLHQCARLLNQVPLLRLQRKMSLDLLPELVDLIGKDIESPHLSQV